MDIVLSEAKRLHDLGFAILPLHSKSKRPKESKWTTGDRGSFEAFKKPYKTGDNIGVRTGSPSKIGNEYLACIDVDVKNPVYKDRASVILKELIGDIECPQVISGSGNSSRHLYCRTKIPFKMLTIDKTDDGEICVYSNGRQMVLPPSIHPSGKPYKWANGGIKKASDLPLIEFKISPETGMAVTSKVVQNTTQPFSFQVQEVDVSWLPISEKILKGITIGEGINDRSAFLLTATTALYSAGLDRDEILSVLTNPTLFISKCGADRRGKNRASQAQWLWEYTVKKVMTERSAESLFKPVDEMKPAKILTPEEVELQTKEFKEERSWKQDIRRSGQGGMGPPVGNIENVVLILENAIGGNFVRRNEFAYRDTYGVATPWGAKVDTLLSDDEVVKIKYWLGTNFGFEPKNQIIEEALIILACRNAYDPVKDWLNELPEWDKVPRLGSWLKKNFQAKGDPEYLSQVFTKWILAMIARAFQPGIKFDWMPIFEGKQGIGKSSFGRLLVGDSFFLDWLPNLTDKDSALALQGIWSVEMGELANMRRNQLEDVKSYLTRTTDKVRPPYGRRTIEAARRCVFFGTTNRETYLIDDTGNRRFKPIEVGNLNFKALKRDRDQLFSEAKFIWDTQSITELTFELSGRAKIFEAQIHQEKMIEDEATLMRDAMKEFIEKVDSGQANFDFEKFRILDLFSGVGPLNRWKADNRNSQFAAKMLKKYGGEKRMINGFRYWKIDLGARSDDEADTLDFR